MPSALFDLECDRLLRVADPANYLQQRWERNEGAVLKGLLGRIRDFFAHRPEFVLQERESEPRNLVASIGPSEEIDQSYFFMVLEIEGTELVFRARPGADYAFVHEQLHTAPVGDLSDEWLEKTLRATLANLRRREIEAADEETAREQIELSTEREEAPSGVSDQNVIPVTSDDVVPSNPEESAQS